MATGGPSATKGKKKAGVAAKQRQVEGADAEEKREPESLRDMGDRVKHGINKLAENTHFLMAQLIEDFTALQNKTNEKELEKELERKTGQLHISPQSFNEYFENARELFFVRRLDQATTQQDQAMIFKKVDINEGGHYQPDTGRFTAPWPGLYFFSAGVKSNSKSTAVSGHIMVDDVLYRDITGGSDGGSGLVMEQLRANQTVWVKANSPVGQYGVQNGHRNWFRGMLVQEETP